MNQKKNEYLFTTVYYHDRTALSLCQIDVYNFYLAFWNIVCLIPFVYVSWIFQIPMVHMFAINLKLQKWCNFLSFLDCDC